MTDGFNGASINNATRIYQSAGTIALTDPKQTITTSKKHSITAGTEGDGITVIIDSEGEYEIGNHIFTIKAYNDALKAAQNNNPDGKKDDTTQDKTTSNLIHKSFKDVAPAAKATVTITNSIIEITPLFN